MNKRNIYKPHILLYIMETVTITIDRKIWRKLAQIKINKGLRNYNQVLRGLLKKEGAK